MRKVRPHSITQTAPSLTLTKRSYSPERASLAQPDTRAEERERRWDSTCGRVTCRVEQRGDPLGDGKLVKGMHGVRHELIARGQSEGAPISDGSKLRRPLSAASILAPPHHAEHAPAASTIPLPPTSLTKFWVTATHSSRFSTMCHQLRCKKEGRQQLGEQAVGQACFAHPSWPLVVHAKRCCACRTRCA